MRILVLDAALARLSAAIAEDASITATRTSLPVRGQQGLLAAMLQAVLRESPGPLDAVCVTIGPGSFTGLRTALALAHGVATSGARLVAVSVAEALAADAGTGRPVWTAIDSRRGRVFLDRDGTLESFAIDALPEPSGPLAIAGDAAIAVAAALAGRGFDVRLTGARLPTPLGILAAGMLRLNGALLPCAPQPLYVDAPEAKLPAGGLRPAPFA